MKKHFLFCVLLAAFGCKEKYVPKLRGSAAVLVVEGFINSGVGATTITLTNSTAISDTASIRYERGAAVTVVSKSGSASFKLTETSPGVYTHPQLTLNNNEEYRLQITSTNGYHYVSDYSAVRNTPDFDSIYWNRKNGGVQTYVATHDPTNTYKYYQWKYDETWEFHSAYASLLKFGYDRFNNLINVVYREPTGSIVDSSIYTCWKTVPLTTIELGSTDKLSQPVIPARELTYIEPDSWKLSVRYSINVKQYALSEANYHFLVQMKKNTEQLGSIFDPQPSDNNGNMHCVETVDAIVVGFVEVLQERQKRIFITNAQVPDWRYRSGCDNPIRVENFRDSIRRYGPGRLPTTVADGDITGIKYAYLAQEDCVDCTIRGVNKKPTFW